MCSRRFEHVPTFISNSPIVSYENPPSLLFVNDSGPLEITATFCLSSGGRDFRSGKVAYRSRILLNTDTPQTVGNSASRAISHLASSRPFSARTISSAGHFSSLLPPFASVRSLYASVSLRAEVTKNSCQRKRMVDWMAAVNVEAWDPGTPWIVLVKMRILWMAKNGSQTKQS